MSPDEVRKIVASLPPVPDSLTVAAFKGIAGEPLVLEAEAMRAVKESGGALMIVSATNARFLARPVGVGEGVLDMEMWARIAEPSEVVVQ